VQHALRDPFLKVKSNHQQEERNKNESTDSVQTDTNSTISHRTNVYCRAHRAGCAAAWEHGPAVEHDRRGHSRRLERVPAGGLSLHGLPLGCGVRRRGRDRGRFRAIRSSDHGTAGRVGRLCSRRGSLPHTSLLFLVVPGSRGEPRRLLRRGALKLRRLHCRWRRGHSCRPDSRDKHHRAAYGRRPDDSDQCDVIIPDATAGSGRVAPHATIRGAADAMDWGGATICPAQPRPVPA
jgi:hypothetical protein